MNERWLAFKDDCHTHDSLTAGHLEAFVNTTMPELLRPIADQPVTPETLMQAQWFIAGFFSLHQAPNDFNDYHCLTADLSVYRKATESLQLAGKTPEDFYQENGIEGHLLSKTEAGQLTIAELLDTRPLVFFWPINARLT